MGKFFDQKKKREHSSSTCARECRPLVKLDTRIGRPGHVALGPIFLYTVANVTAAPLYTNSSISSTVLAAAELSTAKRFASYSRRCRMPAMLQLIRKYSHAIDAAPGEMCPNEKACRIIIDSMAK